MSKIFEFFKAKKLEKKFSRLGEGHKLGESSDKQEPSQLKNNSGRVKPESESRTERTVCEPSAGAAKAAEAALERLNRQNKPQSSIKNAVWRDAEQAVREEREAQKLRERLTQTVIVTDKPKVLSRVLFWCPALFGPSKVGPFEQIDEAIHDYLLEEATVNLPEAAALILVRGLARAKPPPSPDIPLSEQPKPSEWREKLKQFFTRVLNNLITSPDNPTYRRLRTGNQLVSELLSVDGAKMFFQACGFVEQELPVEQRGTTTEGTANSSSPPSGAELFLVISEEAARDSEHLQKMLDLFSTAEPISPTIYRDTQVFRISGTSSLSVARDQLPDEFFTVTKEEVKRMLEQQQRIVAEGGMLLTKAMREKLRTQEIRMFRYVLIRVRFPCDYVIQGTFYAHDVLGTLRSWITDCLAVPSLEYQLWAPPGTVPAYNRAGVPASGHLELTNNAATITELGLAPSSVLNISFPNYPTTNDASELLSADLLANVATI